MKTGKQIQVMASAGGHAMPCYQVAAVLKDSFNLAIRSEPDRIVVIEKCASVGRTEIMFHRLEAALADPQFVDALRRGPELRKMKEPRCDVYVRTQRPITCSRCSGRSGQHKPWCNSR